MLVWVVRVPKKQKTLFLRKSTPMAVAVTRWNSHMKEERAHEITGEEGFSLHIRYLDSPQLQTPVQASLAFREDEVRWPLISWLECVFIDLPFIRTPLLALPPFNATSSNSTFLSMAALGWFVFIYLFALNLYICCISTQNIFPHFVLEMPIHLQLTA